MKPRDDSLPEVLLAVLGASNRLQHVVELVHSTWNHTERVPSTAYDADEVVVVCWSDVVKTRLCAHAEPAHRSNSTLPVSSIRFGLFIHYLCLILHTQSKSVKSTQKRTAEYIGRLRQASCRSDGPRCRNVPPPNLSTVLFLISSQNVYFKYVSMRCSFLT